MEVRKRFKGLDLIDREPDELWAEVYDLVQETGIETILTVVVVSQFIPVLTFIKLCTKRKYRFCCMIIVTKNKYT